LQSVTFDTLPCGRVLFAAFVLSCLFSIAAVYMANKVEYIIDRVKSRHISMVAIRSPFCRSRPSYCA